MMAKKWNITLLYVHIKMTHHPSSQLLMRILELPTILEMLCYYAGQLRCDIFFRGTFDQSFIISYRSIEPIYKWLIEDTNCAHKKWSNYNLFENTFFSKFLCALHFPDQLIKIVAVSLSNCLEKYFRYVGPNLLL